MFRRGIFKIYIPIFIYILNPEINLALDCIYYKIYWEGTFTQLSHISCNSNSKGMLTIKRRTEIGQMQEPLDKTKEEDDWTCICDMNPSLYGEIFVQSRRPKLPPERGRSNRIRTDTGHELGVSVERVQEAGIKMLLCERYIEDSNQVAVVPKAGRVLVFQHDILHEGSTLVSGTKYAMRTDVMYKCFEK